MRAIIPCGLVLFTACSLGALERKDSVLTTGVDQPRATGSGSGSGSGSESGSSASALGGKGCEQPQRPEPALTTRERDCGPDADHCLRPNTWFAESNLKSIVRPTFECGGLAYEWSSLEPARRAIYRTRAATDADIAVGVTVIYYVHHNGRSQLPVHEHDSHAPDKWLIGVVSLVDPQRRTFELERDPIDRPFEAARVIVETQGAPQASHSASSSRSSAGGSSGPGGIEVLSPAARTKIRSLSSRTWSAESKV
jgi:hypothetical protein